MVMFAFDAGYSACDTIRPNQIPCMLCTYLVNKADSDSNSGKSHKLTFGRIKKNHIPAIFYEFTSSFTGQSWIHVSTKNPKKL